MAEPDDRDGWSMTMFTERMARGGKRRRELVTEQIDSSTMTQRGSTHCRVPWRSRSWARGVLVALTALFTILDVPALLAQTGAPGSLDTSFNGTGQAVSSFTIDGGRSGLDALIDPQGRVVVGTGTDDRLGRLDPLIVGVDSLAARYNFNGTSLDLGFGDQNSDLGTVITDWGFFNDSWHEAIALDSVGRIVAVGSARDLDCCGGGVVEGDFAISRYTSQGIPDATFGVGGRKRVGFDSDSDFGHAVAIDSSGRIIAAGSSTQGCFLGFCKPNADLALVRLLPNGDFDASFDGDGKVITDLGGTFNEGVEKLLIDHSGRIIAVGSSLVDDGSVRIAMVRYNVDGSLDSTFSGDGKLFASFGLTDSLANDAALDSVGRILVAGVASAGTEGGFIALARFNEDGSFDVSFGDRGATLTDIQGNEEARSIALDSLGRIIVAGTSSRRAFDSSIAVTRYTPDGLLDTTFGLAGVRLTELVVDGEVAQHSSAHDVEIDSANRILVAGGVFTLTNEDPVQGFSKLALVRYHNGSTGMGNVTQLVGTLRTAGAIDSDGVATALTQQLAAAATYTDSGDLASAEDVLGSFINLVNAQRKRKHIAATATIDGITFDPAAVLVSHARSLITDLGATQNR